MVYHAVELIHRYDLLRNDSNKVFIDGSAAGFMLIRQQLYHKARCLQQCAHVVLKMYDLISHLEFFDVTPKVLVHKQNSITQLPIAIQ
jgi:hypothetical protein